MTAKQTPAVDSPAWWAAHGVAVEVKAARRYVRWTTDNVDPVREAYAGLSEGQLRTLLGWAQQSDGLVIYRHSFEGAPRGDLHYVYPEIRPDEAVQTDIVWHYHGRPVSEPPRLPKSGKPLSPRQILKPESVAAHIARDRDPDDHRGVNSNEVHPHRALAKYVFPPSATVSERWFHSHLDEYRARLLDVVPMVDENGEIHEREIPPDALERLEARFAAWLEAHVGKHHPDMDVAQELEDIRSFVGGTQHEHSRRIKRGGEQLAKRIDVNPLVWKHGGFEQAERVVFFAIEGCIKADAILTALLRSGEPPAVFSVPSVSLWEATYPVVGESEDEFWLRIVQAEIRGETLPEPTSYEGDELAAFARSHLAGKLVCIVPDADAYTKDEVMTQALLCRSTLRRLNTRAEILLPPDDRLDEGIKGVDDHLGEGGGTLEQMVWYRKEPPAENELVDWLRSHAGGKKWRSDALRRAATTLHALATHAGENGGYTASVRLLARATSRRRGPRPRRDPEAETEQTQDPDAARKKFERGIKDLLDIGAITTNKPLSVRQEHWTQPKSWRWAEDNVVITLHEALRARTERRSYRDLMTS